MTLLIKQAHDDLRHSSDQIDQLREKVTFYEKTFPLTLTRHKRSFIVPPLHINSEPTQHNERQTTHDTTTTNTAKQPKHINDYTLIMQDKQKDTQKYSEKSLQLHNMRTMMNQGSMHSSIGTSKKNLSEVEIASLAM